MDPHWCCWFGGLIFGGKKSFDQARRSLPSPLIPTNFSREYLSDTNTLLRDSESWMSDGGASHLVNFREVRTNYGDGQGNEEWAQQQGEKSVWHAMVSFTSEIHIWIGVPDEQAHSRRRGHIPCSVKVEIKIDASKLLKYIFIFVSSNRFGLMNNFSCGLSKGKELELSSKPKSEFWASGISKWGLESETLFGPQFLVHW